MFSELAVGYLFLGGTGAGGCMVVALLSLLIARCDLAAALQAQFRSGEGRLFRSLLSPLLVVSLGALLLGVACLLADLGQPARVLLLAFSGKVTHLTVGAWALTLCSVAAAWLLLVWRGVVAASPSLFRAANGILLALALVVAAYTGLLLSSLTAVPLWNNAVLPALFVASALSCGFALAAGLASVSEVARTFATTLRRLQIADMAVIAIEALLLVAWLAWAPSTDATPTGQAAAQSAAQLLHGSLAPLFWGGFAAVGLLLPFCVEAVAAVVSAPRPDGAGASSLRRETWSRVSLVTAAGSVLVGGFLLRYLVVTAALQPVSVIAPLL
ncbi:NrfD/PsrC family molybdoenzyme membrane anchor subunit [Parvibacter caecicola]|uniref:NrfD/PsrC family molybdoenzyme membrane anchor subunit n=1 Tax=Parvibacter caecicola TaxID=747645 RepID=UPI00145C74C5|nr:NrfD/PsrC family molybdoenzyme membrane anchor subunit [Parvibacter caecicola]